MTSLKKKKIIAIIGMPGAGKSTIVDMLVSQYKFPHIYFGNFTLTEVKKRGMEINQENEKMMRHQLRKEHGMGAYAYLALPTIKEYLEKSDTILIDGLYSWSEYTYLQKADIGELLLLVVISQRKKRYERLAVRKTRALTPEEAQKRDFAEIEVLEKGGPIALCDYYVTNDSTVECLEKQVKQVIEQILI